MVFACSYIGFSSKRQKTGNSLRRQTELSRNYAAKNGLILDDALSFRDLGVSAYTKANVEKGVPGKFLDAVNSGIVPSGAYLLVESFDRLSRSQVIDAEGFDHCSRYSWKRANDSRAAMKPAACSPGKRLLPSLSCDCTDLPELKDFPMKGRGRQAVADQRSGQRFAPGGRAAEPDAAAGSEAGADFGRL